MITDTTFCSKTCSLKVNCTCSILFTNHRSDGCHSFVDTKQIQKKNVSIIGINTSDLMVGLYLISMGFADIIVGDNYVEIDLPWRASLPCQTLGFTSLLVILISTF